MVGDGYISINIFSKSAIAEDIFLGQAVINLNHYPELYRHKSVEVSVPVQFATQKVFSSTGDEIQIPYIENGGSVIVNINIPSIFLNMCGWFYDITTTFYGTITWDKIWVILCNYKFYCYDTPYERVEHMIFDVNHIISIEEVNYDKMKLPLRGLEIKLSSGKILSWAWASYEMSIKGLWYRALENKLNQIAIKKFLKEKNKSYFPTNKKRLSMIVQNPPILVQPSQQTIDATFESSSVAQSSLSKSEVLEPMKDHTEYDLKNSDDKKQLENMHNEVFYNKFCIYFIQLIIFNFIIIIIIIIITFFL